MYLKQILDIDKNSACINVEKLSIFVSQKLSVILEGTYYTIRIYDIMTEKKYP